MTSKVHKPTTNQLSADVARQARRRGLTVKQYLRDGVAPDHVLYGATLTQWKRACKHEEKYADGVVAICLLKHKHRGICIHEVPKSYKEPEKPKPLQYKPEAHTETNMAKKSAVAEQVEQVAEKQAKKRGNAEALKKAREAGVKGREEARARKIKVLASENPKREGSAAHKKFSLYKNGMTVGEFLDKGGTSSCIAYDVKHGYIEVK